MLLSKVRQRETVSRSCRRVEQTHAAGSYTNIETRTHRQTHGHTDRHTDTQTAQTHRDDGRRGHGAQMQRGVPLEVRRVRVRPRVQQQPDLEGKIHPEFASRPSSLTGNPCERPNVGPNFGSTLWILPSGRAPRS
jgi:hypothetical protein